jgi:Leucine-rich repeat (LRR) protein
LQELWLDENSIGDEGMKAFSSALSSGALASLQKLYLHHNQIGDAGMIAFAEALKPTDESPMGALASLEKLYLVNNPASDSAKNAVKAVASSRSINLII